MSENFEVTQYQLYSEEGVPIVGVKEALSCDALISGAQAYSGSIGFNLHYDGESVVNWDSQAPVMGPEGIIFVDENDKDVPESLVYAVPEGELCERIDNGESVIDMEKSGLIHPYTVENNNEVDIRFEVDNAAIEVTQTIQIATADSPDEFLDKLKTGQYMTTMNHANESMEGKKSGANVLSLPDMAVVGSVVAQQIHIDQAFVNFSKETA